MIKIRFKGGAELAVSGQAEMDFLEMMRYSETHLRKTRRAIRLARQNFWHTKTLAAKGFFAKCDMAPLLPPNLEANFSQPVFRDTSEEDVSVPALSR